MGYSIILFSLSFFYLTLAILMLYLFNDSNLYSSKKLDITAPFLDRTNRKKNMITY